MKRNKIILVSLFMAVFSLCNMTFAQSNDIEKQQKWMSEFREYKQDFLIKQTQLTEDQQKAFFPLYHEMEDAIFTANKEARDIEKKFATKENATESEYQNAVGSIVDTKMTEAEIESKYFKKFSEILSSKQLFMLKKAESEFSRYLLNHLKKQTPNK